MLPPPFTREFRVGSYTVTVSLLPRGYLAPISGGVVRTLQKDSDGWPHAEEINGRERFGCH